MPDEEVSSAWDSSFSTLEAACEMSPKGCIEQTNHRISHDTINE